MKLTLIACFVAFSVSVLSQPKLPDHAAWTALLKKHVNAKGMVNYKAIQADLPKLEQYLDQLSANEPDRKWSTNEKLAFWINAYNAYTVKLILDYYEHGKLKSIKDIGTIIPIPRISDGWSKKFIKIGNKTLSLNNIENDIIRKDFKEPRIHVALVCAAKSCPRLRNEAYLPNTLALQLDDNFRDFINDSSKNIVKDNQATLSPIFDWYSSDFTKIKPMTDWLNMYSKVKINSNAKINFGSYDWSLNEAN